MDPPPPPAPTPISSSSPPSSTPPTIHTHHHLPCTHLLLATTYDLASLPRRAAPGLDRALILPLPSVAAPASSTTTDADADADADETGLRDENGHYSILLQTTLAARAVVMRREDGFEKRRVVRCGRCGGAVGYFLLDKDGERDGEKGRERRRVYLLPGGMVETGTMVSGERIGGEGEEGWWVADGVI